MDSGRLETVPNGTVHLDTVRALHQTVVSLRTALEVSKNELKELKEKYEQHSHCLEYADVIEKLTLENHVLRRRIIDSGYEEKDPSQNIKLEVTYSPRSQNTDNYTSEVVIETATDLPSAQEDSQALEPYPEPDENSKFCSSEKLNEIPEVSEPDSPELNLTADFSPLNTHTEQEEQSQAISLSKTDHLPSFKTKLELLSKFDVRIKVRTLKEGTIVSSTTSDSDSVDDKKEREDTATFQFEHKREEFDKKEDFKGNKVNFTAVSTENVKMAVPNEGDIKSKADKFDVQVKITSEENLEIKENFTERSRRKDTLNLDVDDLSLRSMSEGDNSVFSEGVTTPMGPPADDKQEHEASGNESEEVDDIELIFTTDESKDMSNLQEDLVSIRETDSWAPNSSSTTHSTPVLIKFHTLDPDFQPGAETDVDTENQENSGLQNIAASSLKVKRVSLPNDKEIRHVAFNNKGSLDLPGRGILKSCDNRSDNMLYRKSPNTSTRRLDSVDSLTCDYNRGLSLDNTKSSSFELGSSMDILHRDESVDSFHKTCHLGHRFSVFAERDISKCGTSEDDLAVSLNIRRNTCPNPFQYRVPPYRGVSRAPGPFKAPLPSARMRPVLREPVGLRRETAAQTELSALPNRWSSDGYLAHKMSVVPCAPAPTLPQRVTSRRTRLPPPPAKRNDDTRRVLLSDIDSSGLGKSYVDEDIISRRDYTLPRLSDYYCYPRLSDYRRCSRLSDYCYCPRRYGFTSMVPELSRSADPVWALAKKQGSDETITNSASKFLSRGSSYRSPCMSIDRSSDWTPQSIYVPNRMDYRPWRSSLPDVRRDDTDDLLEEAEIFVRRSIDNLQTDPAEFDKLSGQMGQPYIPASPKQLRLGHTVKVITPHGRIAIGRVRYVGLAGGTAASSSVVVGAEFCNQQNPCLPRNDGTHRGRRYFLTPPHYTALFVPFSKIVMAWAN